MDTLSLTKEARVDAFELWCWRLLRAPWTTRRSNLGVNPERNQSWIFIERTDAEAPTLWPHDGKSWLTGKDPDAGRDWGQEKKQTTEDEMAGWHHQLNGLEFGQAPGDSERQGTLACCGSWGCKESDTTEWLDWTELNKFFQLQLLKR